MIGRFANARWMPAAVIILCGTKSHAERHVSYSRDIKPIFSNSCFTCHGPDEGSREADFRLDERESAVASAIKPGAPELSELVHRISTDEPDEQMPPADSHRARLTPDQIDVVRKWISEGAKYDDHWSYQTPERPEPPTIKRRGWAKNPIDRFIGAGLDEHSIAPAPDADRVTLIRRIYHDTSGLPPKPEDVERFASDTSEYAYDDLVDRLLASRHYGERMAIFWLDQVRYADSSGIHNDYHRDHYLYRDYVIDSFNDNKPFDRFTIEQLAGDLQRDAGRAQMIASGYNRLNMSTEEAGSQEKEFRAKYAADRVRNASSVWLAATLGCAECHDHKFDPYTIRDFYSFAAFFGDLQEPAVTVDVPTVIPSEKQRGRLNELEGQIVALKSQLQTTTPELAAAQQRWEERVARLVIPWDGLATVRMASNTATLTTLEDGSILASGTNADSDWYLIEVKSTLAQLAAIRIDVLTDPSLPHGGPGRAPNGNFVLTEVRVSSRSQHRSHEQPLALVNAYSNDYQDGHTADLAIDEYEQTGWAGFNRDLADHFAVFTFGKPIDGKSLESLVVKLRFNSPHPQHNLGRFRLTATAAGESVAATGVFPNVVAQTLSMSVSQRSEVQREALRQYFLSICDELASARTRLVELEQEREQLLAQCPKLLVSKSGEPRVTRILARGNWQDDSGEIVSPAIPATFGQLEVGDRLATRLDLARWLVNRDNPLTARVFVNRLWKLAFGQGLAKNLDDFGSQGGWPSNNELLDWLAVEFRDSGWDVKHILRLIYTSATYRQSSIAGRSAEQMDPANELVSRQRRFRMDAEFVRDAALLVSGLYYDQIGGPSVKPYQPAGYWDYLNYPKRDYVPEADQHQYRRGLYTHWQRTLLHPSLLAFDAPTRESCTVERNRSNTPLQALVMLNDPTYVEAARGLAERTLSGNAGNGDDERMSWMVRQVFTRPIRPAESTALAKLLHSQRCQYRHKPDDAKKLVSVGNHPAPQGLDPVELAAWTSVARAVLNSHAFITRN